ncbi:unnamed protein product [Alopecurus aequalis]
MDRRCATKRKAKDDMCNCATKRKLEQKAPPAATSCEGEGHRGGNVEAPTRQMARLPQEEIDRILSMTKPGPYLNPDDREPNPFSTPEELEEDRERYRFMNESFESTWAFFSEFQAWVRSEFAAKGFVEVDADFLADWVQNGAEVKLEEVDLSEPIIGEDDDYVMGEVMRMLGAGDEELLIQENPFMYE